MTCLDNFIGGQLLRDAPQYDTRQHRLELVTERTEIHARILFNLFGETIHGSENDNVYAGIAADFGEWYLGITVSPVDGNIRAWGLIVVCEGREGEHH